MGANSIQQSPQNPYIGPVPFNEGQKLHGRTRDTQALADLLISKRIVLLISPSGAGKTSLIQAALLPRLKSYLHPLPIVRLNRTPRGEGDKANRYVFSTLQSLEARFPKEERFSDEVLGQLTLPDYFVQRSGTLGGGAADQFPLIILDQFEELFTLDRLDWKWKYEFIIQLGQALGASIADEGYQQGKSDKEPTPVWALLSMREDHVAELEPFLEFIPTGLAFRYRLEPLDREQALEAVTGPAKAFFAKEAAERLVDELRKVRVLASAGETDWHLGRFVEPVQLQVVCLRLWDKVVGAEGRPIIPSDIDSGEQTNEVDTALASYYDLEVEQATAVSGMFQRDVRDWIQDKLITRTKVRTRILHDTASSGNIDKVINCLHDGHVLRIDLTGDRKWVELSHDRLIEPVLKSNKEWSERHLALFQKQAKLWVESGRPDDLLFFDKELVEAEKFEVEHREELSPDDEAFLVKSRLKREAVAEDLRQRQEIEDQNQKLKHQQLLLGGITAVAVALCIVAVISWDILRKTNEGLKIAEMEIGTKYEELDISSKKLEEKRKELDHVNIELEEALVVSVMPEAVVKARGGGAPQALRQLVGAGEKIDKKNFERARGKLDRSLIGVLGGYAPIVKQIGTHNHLVRALEFSSDGKLLFSGGWDNKIKVWPLTEYPEAYEFDDHHSDIYSLAFNQINETLASTDQSGLIILWQVIDGRLQKIATLNADHDAHTRRITSAAFNPDGRLLATASYDKTIVLWNVSNPAKPTKVASFGGRYHLSPIYRIAFLNAGPYTGKLVSADLNGNVAVWKVIDSNRIEDQKPELKLSSETIFGKNNNEIGIYAMTVSPSGRWIATGNSGGKILVWDLKAQDPSKAGALMPQDLSHQGKIFSMAFSRDSQTLVTVGSDEVLLEWQFPSEDDEKKGPIELEKKVMVTRVGGWGEKLYSVALHPQLDGVVAIGGSKSVRIADLNRANPIAKSIIGATTSHQYWRDFASTPDLRILATLATNKKSIVIWHREGDQYKLLLEPLIAHSELARIAVAPNGNEIAALSCNGELLLWSINALTTSGPSILNPAQPPSVHCPPAALAFARDGKLLATATRSVLQLWFRDESEKWQRDESINLGKNILTVAFNPRSDLLAVAGEFDRIKTWKIAGGRINLEAHDSEDQIDERVRVIAFAPNGETLVTGSEDSTIREWVLPELKIQGQSYLHKRAVSALTFGLSEKKSVLFSADVEGQLVMCFDGIDEDKCGRVGSASQNETIGLATNNDLNQLIVSGNGLWSWDLRRDNLRDVAKSLSAKSP